MARIIVERTFAAPLSRSELSAVEERLKACLDLREMRRVRSYWSVDRRRMICEYEAVALASFRNVRRKAGALSDRALAPEVLEEP